MLGSDFGSSDGASVIFSSSGIGSPDSLEFTIPGR